MLCVPRIILRYVSVEFMKTFIVTLGVVTTACLFASAVLLLRHEPIGPKQFLMTLPISASMLLKYTLPMAVLFGASLAYGRMAAENEVRALEWNGVHIGWLLVPAAAIAVAASVAALYLNAYVVPASRGRLERILEANALEILDRQLVRASQKTESAMPGFRNLSIVVQEYDRKASIIHGLIIIQTDKNDPTKVKLRIDAESAQIIPGRLAEAIAYVPDDESPADQRRPERLRKYVTFKFTRGYISKYDPESTTMTTRGPALPVALDLSLARETRSDPHQMRMGELARYMSTVENKADRLKARTQFFERLALGMSPFFLVLFAAPMAMVGRWNHVLTAVLPSMLVGILIYYPLIMLAAVLGEGGQLDPIYGMCIPNALMLLLSTVVFTVLLRR